MDANDWVESLSRLFEEAEDYLGDCDTTETSSVAHCMQHIEALLRDAQLILREHRRYQKKGWVCH